MACLYDRKASQLNLSSFHENVLGLSIGYTHKSQVSGIEMDERRYDALQRCSNGYQTVNDPMLPGAGNPVNSLNRVFDKYRGPSILKAMIVAIATLKASHNDEMDLACAYIGV
jgi:hypothetical protein